MYFKTVRTISRRLEDAEIVLDGDFALTIICVLPMPPSAVGQRPADLVLDETNGITIEIRRWHKADEVEVPDASRGLAVA